MAVHVSRRGDQDREPTERRVRRRATDGPARRPDHPDRAHGERCHPCVLGPGLPVQARRDPRAHVRLRPHANQDGNLLRGMRRVLRAEPRVHDVQRSRGSADRVRDVARADAGRTGGGVSVTMERPVAAQPEPPHRVGPVERLTSTDHKNVGILYCVTAFGFFLVGGALAGLMRVELAEPARQVVSTQAYNTMFTIHGTVMIFLFVAPFGIGLANYLIPLHIGAPDMAFPRLNLTSYWFFAGAGLLILLSGAASTGGGAAMGWYAYTPLSEMRYSPGVGVDLWILGIVLVAISNVMGGVNILATVFLMRAPGMTMWRLPIFTWNMVVTAILGLVAFPPAVAAFALLLIDRRLGGHAFDPLGGGDPALYQHLFWFLGHPEVYILILPFFGIITEVIPVFSRKPLFGYLGLVLATIAIGALSMGVWAHHMFTTGVVNNPFFSAMSLLIAVPTGVKFFAWTGTMWKGKISFTVPMLFAIFAGIYFWFPKMTGAMLRERLGRVVAVLLFVGFNLTFWPQFVLGLRGFPRRYVSYPADIGFDTPNLVSTIGYAVMFAGVVVFLADVAVSLRRRIPAGGDPWGGNSLEWVTTSPPPEHNFDALPQIRSERPAFDLRHPELAP